MIKLLDIQNSENYSPSIENHVAWHGLIAGLEAEELLKDHSPGTYLLRAGEKPFHYYVSFVQTNGILKHQPFCIILTDHGWYCKNGFGTGPYVNQTITDVVHRIMHVEEGTCSPLNRK